MISLAFQLDYHTTWGQHVFVCGSIPELGAFDETKAVPLTHDGGNLWQLHLDVAASPRVEYYYLIKEGKSVARREWGGHRMLALADGMTFHVHDLWKNQPYHGYLYSSVFTDSIFAHQKQPLAASYHPHSILLDVICPYVQKNQTLVVCGENHALGKWDVRQAPQLSCVDAGQWQILLDAAAFSGKTQYKFVIVDSETRDAVYWEDGGNRILNPEKAEQKNNALVEMGLVFHHHSFTYKGTGVAIPVFSLRSDDSFGIGDFLDLRKMVDWAARTNQQMIQVLPVNDTTTTKTWHDSYPYSAISIYALHPLYLGYKEFPLKNEKMHAAFLDEAARLNQLAQLDYEQVLKLKSDYARALFLQDGAAVLASEEYAAFYAKNQSWLFPYACYCYLRDKNNTARFADWGEFSTYDEERLKRMLSLHIDAATEVNYHCFLQFLLDRQLAAVKNYARQKGVALKGDIPIGINRDSIDAWTTAHLFNMDTQTGAPPDDFSVYGQNWGFPTYNWRAMEEEGFAWWKNRFGKMADYFDAYRIDHILGFFRIWEIPLNAVQGLLGYFSPALPYWAEELVQAGIPFDEERMAKPFIHEHYLPEIFGEFTDEVKNTYLEISGWQQFRLKSFCCTQVQIRKLFDGKTGAGDIRIRDGLMSLCAEVLFVRDRHDSYRFHPRITAQFTYSYRYLDDGVKAAFNRLYDDFFYHRHNYFWRGQAMAKLPELISSTSMMVCGEDLGMVPDCVPSVMDELQILSLEIQRMPKDPRATFADLGQLPYRSVCTTSTHDMSPIRAWWHENREVSQRYYNEVLHLDGAAPDDCTPDLCRRIVQAHLNSTAMWVVLPWQDWMSVDAAIPSPNPEEERINVPANPNHYWRYRMHISLDKLNEMEELNRKIAQLAERK